MFIIPPHLSLPRSKQIQLKTFHPTPLWSIFNIITSVTLRSSNRSLNLMFSYQYCVWIPNACLLHVRPFSHPIIQGEHKVFPWWQTFVTRKLREIQTYTILTILMCCKKLLELSYIKKKVCIPRSFLVTNVCNQGKTSCSPCIFRELQLIKLIMQFSQEHCYFLSFRVIWITKGLFSTIIWQVCNTKGFVFCLFVRLS